jgi:hypothetical protein
MSANLFTELECARFLRKKLIARWSGDELVLYDQESTTAHCLNRIAGEMLLACEHESSPIEVAAALRENWPEIEAEVVHASLIQMAAAGLLEATMKEECDSPSRREIIRKLGITAAVALPIVVTSVLIPSPAAAASCATLAQPCSGTKPCCSPLVCLAGICAP